MNLNLTGNHVEITPALRDYVLSKIERITRHFDQIIDINVTLSIDKLKQKAEVTVNLRGKEIFVEADGLDMYASIDSLVDKLDRQILKHKEKNIDRRLSQGGLKDQEFEQSE
ncbi:ribosome-associated translation inhibitor RaiA [Betaproteobacteria bacterium PRO4]|uniref:ribosome hibernation-promoting factor, HPF/YfiA family n=1 Tax=Nitrosomonas sp. TaxID=42353 RepID=UPI00255F1493|nr:ribosome-associated translation inhibitor RaiA [Nitrosomonas sp.]MDL1866699.1 ribosome-associated translation inhibitor RaiA [Betaproteobacteria bacterium PRO4]